MTTSGPYIVAMEDPGVFVYWAPERVRWTKWTSNPHLAEQYGRREDARKVADTLPNAHVETA